MHTYIHTYFNTRPAYPFIVVAHSTFSKLPTEPFLSCQRNPFLHSHQAFSKPSHSFHCRCFLVADSARCDNHPNKIEWVPGEEPGKVMAVTSDISPNREVEFA